MRFLHVLGEPGFTLESEDTLLAVNRVDSSQESDLTIGGSGNKMTVPPGLSDLLNNRRGLQVFIFTSIYTHKARKHFMKF